MTDIVAELYGAAKSCRRQAASAIRMNGPTAVVGEAYQLDKAARLHETAASEIDSLRLSLSEARATGRREGLSEAAKIADKAAASSAISKDRSDVKTSSGNAVFTGHLFAETEAKAIAAAIRAAMEKA